MSYGRECHELAKWFLDDPDLPIDSMKYAPKLAQGIQDYIEDFLSDLEYDRIQELEAAQDAAIERKIDERRLDGK